MADNVLITRKGDKKVIYPVVTCRSVYITPESTLEQYYTANDINIKDLMAKVDDLFSIVKDLEIRVSALEAV